MTTKCRELSNSNQPYDPPKRFLSAAEAAAYLKIHATTLYREIKKGLIPSVRIGGQHRIPTDFIERIMA